MHHHPCVVLTPLLWGVVTEAISTQLSSIHLAMDHPGDVSTHR